MATINSKQIVDEIIAGDGIYQGDPRVIKVVEYTNDWGGLCWGIVYELDPPSRINRYETAPACHNAKVIWRYTPEPNKPERTFGPGPEDEMPDDHHREMQGW